MASVRALPLLALALLLPWPDLDSQRRVHRDLAQALPGGAPARPAYDAPRHYVFFGLERDRIREASFLDSPALGAQLKYTWRELEPEKDRYAVEPILEDLDFLRSRGKRLWVQLQDVSFGTELVNVPAYLIDDPAYGGGAHLQYQVADEQDSRVTPIGWVPRRWDPAVLERFARLLRALGDRLDGKIEGINFAETAVDFGHTGEYFPEGFTFERYRDGIKAMMKGGRDAFRTSTVIVYANFMPGEWIPWTDHGYLKSIYAYAHEIGVGVGGPDLLPHRKGQLDHSYPLIRDRHRTLPAAVAVQSGNYDQLTPGTDRKISVPEIHQFGREYLRLDYIFWSTQEPYYSEEVLPYLGGLSRASASRG